MGVQSSVLRNTGPSLRPDRRHAGFAALALLAAAGPGMAAEAVYQGDIGGSAVTMVIDLRNPIVRGTYYYDRHRTPIRLRPAIWHGARDGALHPRVPGLDEVDTGGLPSARLRFHEVPGSHLDEVAGTWTDYRSGRALPIRLRKVAWLGNDVNRPEGSWPLLQAASTRRFYFEVPVEGGNAVTGVRVMDKASGELAQQIELSTPVCTAGIDTVQVGLEQGRVQLHVGADAPCRRVLFEWNAARGRFEPAI